MRRADRLFQIIQILRRSRAPVTATALARELEVAERTVYRDVRDLVAQRVPIAGVAGLGYVLDRAFDMPPLMLTVEELEAAMLGAAWVAHQGDPALSAAARDLMAKIAHVVPARLRPFLEHPASGAGPPLRAKTESIDMPRLRTWIRDGKKLRVRYGDERGRASERTLWPVVIGYVGGGQTVRILAAWCESRQAFRHFRMDRIVSLTFLEERFDGKPAELRNRWRQAFEAEQGRPP